MRSTWPNAASCCAMPRASTVTEPAVDLTVTASPRATGGRASMASAQMGWPWRRVTRARMPFSESAEATGVHPTTSGSPAPCIASCGESGSPARTAEVETSMGCVASTANHTVAPLRFACVQLTRTALLLPRWTTLTLLGTCKSTPLSLPSNGLTCQLPASGYASCKASSNASCAASRQATSLADAAQQHSTARTATGLSALVAITCTTRW